MWLEIIYVLNIIALVLIIAYCTLALKQLYNNMKHVREIEKVIDNLEIKVGVINELPKIEAKGRVGRPAKKK